LFIDVNVRACPTPPVKRAIFDEVIKILKQKHLLLGIHDEIKVDANWLLLCLSTLNP
jgi:hypothetical protein